MYNILVVKSNKSLLNVKTSKTILSFSKQGPAGKDGINGGGAVGYEHNQRTPSLSWSVNHGLNINPVMQVYDINRKVILADIQHLSLNQSIVTFNLPTSGFVRCI